jgi:hypothetical protein
LGRNRNTTHYFALHTFGQRYLSIFRRAALPIVVGDVGQHPGGIAVDGQFHAVSFWKKTVETRRPTEPISIGPSFGVPK